jgi:hypothetical protein
LPSGSTTTFKVRVPVATFQGNRTSAEPLRGTCATFCRLTSTPGWPGSEATSATGTFSVRLAPRLRIGTDTDTSVPGFSSAGPSILISVAETL